MAKSNEMPDPQVFEYRVYYKITPIFINDLNITLADVAYVDARKFFSVLEDHHYILPAAILNEFIRNLSNLPYKYVSGLMSVINNKELFGKYFETLTKEDVEALMTVNKNSSIKENISNNG